jgi:hypothetical protein
MNQLKEYYFNERAFYIADEVRDVSNLLNAYFHGTSKGIRTIIAKKSIPPEHYTYGNKCRLPEQYNLSNASSRRSTLFISVEWTNQYILNNMNTTAIHDIKSTIDTDENAMEDAPAIQTIQYEISPPIIHLDDDEKLKDDDGNIVEIETCGTKTVDGIYFYGKDVERVFGLSGLHKIVNHPDCRYEEGIHYKKFIRNDADNLGNHRNRQITIYLTYHGIVHLLFTCRHPIAIKFTRWVINVIFVVQMGNNEQKIELFSKSLGFEPRVMQEVLNRNSLTLPCIYLVSLGIAKDLRLSMNIPERFPDDGIVCKYGYSDDFKQRLYGHVSKYKGIQNAKVRVLKYAYIDPINTSKAETELSQLMNIINSKFQYKDETELVVISPEKEQQDFVFKQFTQLGKAYMGHTTELNVRIQELENQLKQQLLEHENQLKQQQLEHENQLKQQLLEHTIELHKKQNEIQRIQYESNMKDEQLKIKDLENEILRLRYNVSK